MIEIATAVEDHLLDALLSCALGDKLADFRCGGDVAAVLLLRGLLAEGGGGGDGHPVEVIDELGVDVVERAVDVEARALGSAGHLLADARVHALADDVALT